MMIQLTSNPNFCLHLFFNFIYYRFFFVLFNRTDYIRHQVEKISLHQPEQYKAPEGEMDTMTSYKHEYVRT